MSRQRAERDVAHDVKSSPPRKICPFWCRVPNAQLASRRQSRIKTASPSMICSGEAPVLNEGDLERGLCGGRRYGQVPQLVITASRSLTSTMLLPKGVGAMSPGQLLHGPHAVMTASRSFTSTVPSCTTSSGQ